MLDIIDAKKKFEDLKKNRNKKELKRFYEEINNNLNKDDIVYNDPWIILALELEDFLIENNIFGEE